MGEQAKPKKTRVTMYDASGRPMTKAIPKTMSATWMRKVYHLGPANVGKFDVDGQSGDDIRERLVRAQTCWCVILLMYKSKFDMVPIQREYFVHAPNEPGKAAKLALGLWRRWEKPRRPDVLKGEEPVDLREDFPKVDDGAIALPMGDEDFDAHWRDVRRQGKKKMAGDPRDPFAFTCMNQDVMLFKTADFQAGLQVTI